MANEDEVARLLRLGETGEHPDGKLNEDDEGALRIGVTADDGVLKIIFGKPVTWVGMPKEVAINLARAILNQAEKLP